MRLTERFFARDPREVAQDLLGRELVRSTPGRVYHGRITETGAYQGYVEGRKTAGLAYPHGQIFVYTGPRGYRLLTISTESEGVPSVVTIRELYPLEGIDQPVDGAGRLTKALRIDKDFDGKSINGENLWIEGKPVDPERIEFISPTQRKMAANCLGYYRLS